MGIKVVLFGADGDSREMRLGMFIKISNNLLKIDCVTTVSIEFLHYLSFLRFAKFLFISIALIIVVLLWANIPGSSRGRRWPG